MDMKKYAGGGFLKVDDVRDGPQQKAIAAVKNGSFDRPDACFTDGSVLSLNMTNVKTLIKNYGDDSDGWIGREIELRLGTTLFQGKPTESIIIAPISPPLTPAELKATRDRLAANKGVDMNDEIPFRFCAGPPMPGFFFARKEARQ